TLAFAIVQTLLALMQILLGVTFSGSRARTNHEGQVRITQNQVAALLAVIRLDNLRQQRIGLLIVLERIVIGIDSVILAYGAALLCYLPFMIHKVTNFGPIILAAAFILTVGGLVLWRAITNISRLRNGQNSRQARHSNITLRDNFTNLVMQCIAALLNMGADITSLDAQGGFIEADLGAGRLAITIRPTGEGLDHQIQVLSDNYLPTGSIGERRNSENLVRFTQELFSVR
ncbi:MAG: hypothetical protein NTW48_04305, partial [Chloroflexi bacterium]|nr:hypothetical protein [Chloroflexota bacterium]